MKNVQFFFQLSLTVIFLNSAIGQQQLMDTRFRVYIPPNPPDQLLHSYGPVQEFPTDRIADDFGPRQLSDPYEWHGGIDYNEGQGANGDYGDLFLAVEGGSISEHSLMEGNVKVLAVVEQGGINWRYIHLFNNASFPIELGGCLLQYKDVDQEGNQSEWVIVIRDHEVDINGNITQIFTAYSYEADGAVTFDDGAGTMHTITDISNTVDQFNPLGPIGISGTQLAHLHLEVVTQLTYNVGDPIPAGSNIGDPILAGSDDFVKDPLQFYAHNAPDYNTRFFLEDDLTEGITIAYPGTLEQTIQVHTEMEGENNNSNRYDHVMNVDNVDILLKKDYENDEKYEHIIGHHYESHFSHGARENQDRSETMPIDDITTGDNIIGNFSKTHMQPLAYASNGSEPRDDYYFADFVTRIHQDDIRGEGDIIIADCPSDARYNDGRYDIIARVETVEDAIGDPNAANGTDEPEDITLDNFKPFIQEVLVTPGFINPLGDVFYHRGWSCNDDCILLENYLAQPNFSYSNLNYGLNVDVVSSEPLDNLTMDIYQSTGGGGSGTPVIEDLIPTATHNDGQHWRFFIPATSQLFSVLQTGPIQLVFYGYDTNQNDLIDFEDNTGGCVAVPVRIGDANASVQWENPDNLTYGLDDVHILEIPCIVEGRNANNEICFGGVDYDITPVSSGNNGAIQVNLIDESIAVGDITYTWDNGETGPYLENLAPGTYCVTIEDELCCVWRECVEVVECQEYTFGDYQLSVDIQIPTQSGANNGMISLSVFFTQQMPYSPILKFNWEGPNGYSNEGPTIDLFWLN